MITKANAKKILDITLSSGADFGELFFEDTIESSLKLENGVVSKVNSGNVYGCGIRILKKDKCVYGYTNDISMKSLAKLATTLKDSFFGSKEYEVKPLKLVKSSNKHLPKIPYEKVSQEELLSLLKKAYTAAKEYDEKISKVDVGFSYDNKKITIFNSDGKIVKDQHTRGRMSIIVIASKDGEMQMMHSGPGAQKGFEYFKDEIDVVAIAKQTAKSAITMLLADECPARVMPVIIDNGFGGVIFHEACGHALEASSVAKGQSVFCGKLGERIANEKVSAVDDGTIPNAWGSANIDDEGNFTKRNLLIENGILKGYMVDTLNGRRMNMPSTSSSRRQSYKYETTSRMTNTFILAGEDELEDMIKATPYGLYCKSMSGGSVNPSTGDFNFAVQEGYLIQDGKIVKPVKGASLIGNGAETLLKIDFVGKNLARAQGMCGASSGSIPTDVGQPAIRVSSMIVGGRE